MLRLNIKTKISGFLLLISGAFAMNHGNLEIPTNPDSISSRSNPISVPSSGSFNIVIPEGPEQTNDLLRQMLGEMREMQTAQAAQTTRLEGQLTQAATDAEAAATAQAAQAAQTTRLEGQITRLEGQITILERQLTDTQGQLRDAKDENLLNLLEMHIHEYEFKTNLINRLAKGDNYSATKLIQELMAGGTIGEVGIGTLLRALKISPVAAGGGAAFGCMLTLILAAVSNNKAKRESIETIRGDRRRNEENCIEYGATLGICNRRDKINDELLTRIKDGITEKRAEISQRSNTAENSQEPASTN